MSDSKRGNFFFSSHNNIYCGCSLESHCQGNLNEHSQHRFLSQKEPADEIMVLIT